MMAMRFTVTLGTTKLVDQDVMTPLVQAKVDPPTTGGPMDYPQNETDLATVLQKAADEKRQCLLDPRTKINMTKPIVIKQAGNIGMMWGVNGNGAQLFWKGTQPGDMLTFQGIDGQVNRGLVVEKLSFDGNGYSSATPAGNCLKLYAPDGDPGAIYKFKLKDLYTMYATRGFMLEGAVFEGFCDNLHAENHSSHGMETKNSNINGRNGVISNINIIHPNFSRNMGAGLKCTYSTNLMFGSFVLNALGGVIADDGLRYAAGNNGENTGEAMFNLIYGGYGSVLVGNELSGDAATHARKMVNGAWVDVGKPSLYLLAGADLTAITQRDNHVSYYGGAAANPMRVVKGQSAAPAAAMRSEQRPEPHMGRISSLPDVNAVEER
jgi:hypothetical protein